MKNRKSNKGFSLIEAMVATAIIGIAFTGVFSMTIYSADTLQSAAKRQKLQIIANQIMEVIESDFASVDNYNLDFTTCVAPTSEQTQNYHVNRYKWCRMINAVLGQPRAGDVRSITVTTSGTARIVNVTLQGISGSPEVVLKRIYEN